MTVTLKTLAIVAALAAVVIPAKARPFNEWSWQSQYFFVGEIVRYADRCENLVSDLPQDMIERARRVWATVPPSVRRDFNEEYTWGLAHAEPKQEECAAITGSLTTTFKGLKEGR
jgi:hypothetical protein